MRHVWRAQLLSRAVLPLLAQVEPTAGTWKTWVLTSAKEFPSTASITRSNSRRTRLAEEFCLADAAVRGRHEPDADLDGRPARISLGRTDAEPD